MKRWSATLVVLAVCSVVVHADVTIVQKTTLEGGAASKAPGGAPSATITNRIKGGKARNDMDMETSSTPARISTITDVTARQIIVLDHNQKTARVATAEANPPPAPATAPSATVKVDGGVTPTGRTRTIDGMGCDEYAFNTSMSMSDLGGVNMPPETAAAMQGVTMVMKGSFWLVKDAPGVAEYRAHQKAMAAADLASTSMRASGLNMPGMDKVLKAMQSVDGLPVLTVMDMTIDGTGQMADMMRQMGAMRVTTAVLSVKTDAISDDVFNVPEGYQVIK